MTSPELLQRFKRLDKSSPQFPDQLTNLLYKEGFKDQILKLRDEDVVWLVEYLDEILDSLDSSGPAFRKCLSELGRICGTREQLPHWYTLEGSLSITSGQPVASGGSGDVYKGLLGDSQRVCVKRLRIYAKEGLQAAKKTFYREAVMWRRLAHPNIVPLLGITLDPLQLISAWIPGGELKDYIVHNPDTDKLALLSGIADGLNYLHSRNMVHGDLKGPNILVDDSGCPRIIDFGLAMVTQNQDSVRSAQGEHAHTARWTAPEILSEQGSYSKEADVFSFAMVMVEVFTGEVPFHPSIPAVAILAILDGKRPPRPTHPDLTDELWALMNYCWNQHPHLRPEMSEVLNILCGSNLTQVFTSSQTLIEPTDKTAARHTKPPKHPLLSKNQELTSSTETSPTSQGESTGGGSTQVSGSSQATTYNRIQDENNSHYSEEQEGLSGRPTVLSPSRQGTGGTGQSELYTPLPIDPAQIDSDQLPGWTSKSRANLLDGFDNNNALRENVEGLYVDGNHSPPHASIGPVLTLPDPNQTGDYNDSKSQNPSRTHLARNHSTNNLGNLNQSQYNLRDLSRKPSQSILGAAGGENPSETRPPDAVNTDSDTSLHGSQTGTKPHGRSQMNLGGTASEDPVHRHVSPPEPQPVRVERPSQLVSKPHTREQQGKQKPTGDTNSTIVYSPPSGQTLYPKEPRDMVPIKEEAVLHIG